MLDCLKKVDGKKLGVFAAGVAFGTAGIKVLSSKDAKKLYTNCTAAVLRAKECVLKTATKVQENAEDIYAEAQQINEDRAEAEEVLGEEVKIDPGIIASDSLTKPKAPGMKYKHYAPKADLTMFEGKTENVVKKIRERQQLEEQAGKKTGIICTDESRKYYQGEHIVSIGSRENEESIAANLYAVLRDFDETDVDVILGETFYGDGLGQAIMNRLIKAAGYKLINADLQE